jgi:hypothetical protein
MKTLSPTKVALISTVLVAVFLVGWWTRRHSEIWPWSEVGAEATLADLEGADPEGRRCGRCASRLSIGWPFNVQPSSAWVCGAPIIRKSPPTFETLQVTDTPPALSRGLLLAGEAAASIAVS